VGLQLAGSVKIKTGLLRMKWPALISWVSTTCERGSAEHGGKTSKRRSLSRADVSAAAERSLRRERRLFTER
jgi:hypothetical protein